MPPRKPAAVKGAEDGHSKRSAAAAASSSSSTARMHDSSDDEQKEEESESEESASESGSGSGSSSDGSASAGSDDDEEDEDEEGSSSSASSEDDPKQSRGRGKQSKKQPPASQKKGAGAAVAAGSAGKKGRKRSRDEEDEEADDDDDAAASSSSSSATAAGASSARLSISSFDHLASSPPPGLPSAQLPQLPSAAQAQSAQKSRGSTRQIRKPAAIDDNVSDGEHKPKRRSTGAAAASSSSAAAAADSSSSTAAAAAASAVPATIDPDELSDEWRCNANASLFFRLVRPAPEKDSRDASGAPPTETMQFHPHYTHQLWDDEEIVGYKRVKCVVAFTSGALYTYLHAEYESKVSNAGIADLTDLIGAKLKGGYTTSWAQFQSHIADPFTPPGALMAEYTLPSVEETSKRETISYEVYRGSFSDATLRAYHARLQFFLLFFIDRSSFINDADLVWEVILLFQKRVCTTRAGAVVTTYHIVGYTTLYKFLSYPDDWKMRLSQILILPPYQRCGHGQKLLSLVYADAEKRHMIELNIEDPSPVFQTLRDLTDIQLCKKMRIFEKNGTCDFDPLEVWNLDYAKKVKAALRITMAQVRRCYEIFKLNAINDRHKHSKPMTAYRLEVKARLFREEAEVLSLYSQRPEERKEKLQEMYKEIEEHYLTVIKKARLH